MENMEMKTSTSKFSLSSQYGNGKDLKGSGLSI